MIRYAREDTHYLLYVYDRISVQKFVKNDDYRKDLMTEVIRVTLDFEPW